MTSRALLSLLSWDCFYLVLEMKSEIGWGCSMHPVFDMPSIWGIHTSQWGRTCSIYACQKRTDTSLHTGQRHRYEVSYIHKIHDSYMHRVHVKILDNCYSPFRLCLRYFSAETNQTCTKLWHLHEFQLCSCFSCWRNEIYKFQWWDFICGCLIHIYRPLLPLKYLPESLFGLCFYVCAQLNSYHDLIIWHDKSHTSALYALWKWSACIDIR